MDIDKRIQALADENNRLVARIDELKAELSQLRSERDPMAVAYRLADIILNSGIQCIFCDETDATTYTSSGDFVCETCRDEFEAALENGDTDDSTG